MEKPTQKEIVNAAKYFTFMTEAMNELVRQAGDESIVSVQKMVEFYKNQYEKLSKEHGGMTAVYNTHNFLDNIQSEMVSKAALNNIKPSCKEGCGFCCFQKVDATEDETELILEFCKEKDITIDYDKLKLQIDLTADKYQALDVKSRKCVFLGDDLKCKIYVHRPSMCRSLISVDLPSKCDTESNSKGSILKLNAIHPESIIIAIHMASPSNSLAQQLLNYKLKQ